MPRIPWKDNRLLILVGVMLLATLLCSLTYSTATALRCLLFVTAAGLPLGTGSLWIYRNFWWRPPFWGLLLEAVLIGLVGFEVALLGIVLSSQTQAIPWTQKLTNAAPVGLFAFAGTMLFGPFVLRIARLFRH
jgi:hypothetical protein